MTPSLPIGCVIAVLGAESTGKTELAHALAQRLNDRGIATTLVGEYLREWCDREGRTPRPDEQAAICDEQTRRIDDAASRSVVVTDTTAVMTAVYSDMLFDDASLFASALAAQRRCAITLLTALDLPWVADGLQRDGPHVREPVDTRVRAALAGANLPYTVVHGRGAERIANAWNAINSIAERAGDEGRDGRNVRGGSSEAGGRPTASTWTWPCEKCSDPACEHRLFTDLLAERAAPLPTPVSTSIPKAR
ncbi:ATP-binding protein [Variovorax sp. RTB1]|uniref:ATP-binding protein n=1 Tax=Variovorax sp. RTB1 TaxID=3048631 RepID=UPI002B224BA1|nr:ATP-binding protein [Variovorax sp. RTB1]MEB0113912.1 ATP-binding protein [Variovorax sp. RTB1]